MVVDEGDVGQLRAAAFIGHPAARDGCVAGERDLGKRRVAVVGVVDAAALAGLTGKSRAVCAPVLDGKAIEDGRAISAASPDDVIRVIGVVAQDANVAIQRGYVLVGLALLQKSLGAGKASVNGNPVLEHEAGPALGFCIRRGATAGRGLVGALGDPDLGANSGSNVRQRRLQARVGVGPGGAILGARAGWLHVDDRRRRGMPDRPEDQDNHQCQTEDKIKKPCQRSALHRPLLHARARPDHELSRISGPRLLPGRGGHEHKYDF